MNLKKIVGTLLAVLVSATLLVAVTPTAPADAANGALFDPGNLISDAEFFDGGALSSAAVQNFLNQQVPSCRSGVTCLKDYRQDTPNKAAVAGRCAAYAGRSGESAADIITRVGNACGISQKAMLVLLEKEQGIVTSSAPSSRMYRSATGYGCPDTADCDTLFYGFFNQVYAAALQFQYYAANPTRWNHVPGRVNAVRFHPNAACGSSSVYIQNQATAGLYNYTPYQPNASAVANLYGTGDACGSYGNRNFWRMYTDWFGSPTTASSLLRTNEDGAVFLISGTTKYRVASMSVLQDLAPLGQVGFVSQNYLDRFTLVQNANRVIRATSGAMYFAGAGQKLPFTSCGQVVDYGGQCAASGYTQLTDAQIANFRTGPALTPVMGTQEGPRYFVTAGTKREILDARSQTEAGLPIGQNVLTENAVSDLRDGAPVVRESAVVLQRGTPHYFFLSSGSRSPILESSASIVGIGSQSPSQLRPASLAKIPLSAANFAGIVRGPSDAVNQLLVPGGRWTWPTAPSVTTVTPVAVSAEFLSPFPSRGEIKVGSFVKSVSNPTVYRVGDNALRPISSWDALISVSSGNTAVASLPASVIAPFAKGTMILEAGTLARSSNDPTVYLINGLTNKIPLTSFDMSTEMGVNGLSYVSQSDLDGYPRASSPLGYGVSCGGVRYAAADGSLHAIAAQDSARYPLSFQNLDGFACEALSIAGPAGQFIRIDGGTIYQLVGGLKRPVVSMTRYNQLGGTDTNFISVSDGFAASIPSGPAA